MNGARQCGASACSTPFALDPVSRSVSSRSWKASQMRLSSAPTKGSPGRCPRAGARASCAASDVPTPGACTTSQSRSDGASDDAPSRRTASSSIVEREATTPKVESPLNSIASEKPTNNLDYRTQSELPRAARRRVRAEKKPSTPLRDAKRVRLDRRRSPQIAPRAGFISPPRSSRRDAFPEGFAGVAAGLRRAIPIGTPRRPRRGISPRRVVPFRARREEATARDASSREPLRAVARCPPTLTLPLPARRPRGAPRGLSPPRRTASTSRRPRPRARW